jgi:hypothetical protein
LVSWLHPSILKNTKLVQSDPALILKNKQDFLNKSVDHKYAEAGLLYVKNHKCHKEIEKERKDMVEVILKRLSGRHHLTAVPVHFSNHGNYIV